MPREGTVNRSPDYRASEGKSVAWTLLSRRQSSDCSMSIMVQRFEPGGDFAEHTHDLEQSFYVTKGQLEMTIGGETDVYGEGDFVFVARNEPHSGRNVSDGESEIVAVDYWPADSKDRIGLD